MLSYADPYFDNYQLDWVRYSNLLQYIHQRQK